MEYHYKKYIIWYYIRLTLYDLHLIGSSGISNLLDTGETPPNNAMNEKMAINAIQNALMSYETTVNPTSSTITMPGTPPAYSTAVSSFFDQHCSISISFIQLFILNVLEFILFFDGTNEIADF